jgi:hypothetical protein
VGPFSTGGVGHFYSGANTGIVLSDDPDDLSLGEAALAHGWISVVAHLGGNPQLSLAPDSGPIPAGLLSINDIDTSCGIRLSRLSFIVAECRHWI